MRIPPLMEDFRPIARRGCVASMPSICSTGSPGNVIWYSLVRLSPMAVTLSIAISGGDTARRRYNAGTESFMPVTLREPKARSSGKCGEPGSAADACGHTPRACSASAPSTKCFAAGGRRAWERYRHSAAIRPGHASAISAFHQVLRSRGDEPLMSAALRPFLLTAGGVPTSQLRWRRWNDAHHPDPHNPTTSHHAQGIFSRNQENPLRRTGYQEPTRFPSL